MNAEIQVGIIGCGLRVTYLAKELFRRHPNIRLTALCDPNPSSIRTASEALNFCGTVHEDYHALVEAEDVNWVMIGSWNCYHAEQAIAAMRAGKGVFCEKPLATTFEDCIAMRNVWEHTGVPFYIGFTLRHAPLYRRVKALIDEGFVGRLVSLEFNETLSFNHGGYIHGDWRRLRENAGSHLLEKCCHDIDVANWMTGSMARFAASFGGTDFFTPENKHHASRLGPSSSGVPAYQSFPGGQNPFHDAKDIVDNQVAILEYFNGVRASFHTNCNSGLPERRLYINGTEGAIRADLLPGKIEAARIGWDEPVLTYSAAGGGHGGGDEVLVAELGRCMVTGNTPEVGMQEGLLAAATCFGIDCAMDERSVVEMARFWDRAGVESGGKEKSTSKLNSIGTLEVSL